MCNLDVELKENQYPIIYRKEYNVHFGGLEKLHPFDSGKWGHIVKYLLQMGILEEDNLIKPNAAKNIDLLLVHTKNYLNSLKCSCVVALIAEVPLLCIVPNCLIQHGYLKPMRYQVGGSILAGKVALDRGAAVNIGGGFHHCSSSKGGGFCPYADITLLAECLFRNFGDTIRKIMIVDLDAHQGNGYARDFIRDKRIYILDVYNKQIYPNDSVAKRVIRRAVELNSYTSDEEYLEKVDRHIKEAIKEFRPDFLIYNAGTDILNGDPLGALCISPDGIIQRDEIVFKYATSQSIPIVMLTSGGYLKCTAKIIADSIVNLIRKELLHIPNKCKEH